MRSRLVGFCFALCAASRAGGRDEYLAVFFDSNSVTPARSSLLTCGSPLRAVIADILARLRAGHRAASNQLCLGLAMVRGFAGFFFTGGFFSGCAPKGSKPT